jgi:catechol 2,3-dioxygenase-like lactoylglutathione lyase family enzyme
VQNTSTSISTKLDSISVQVEDMEKTAAFLTDMMGWQRHPGRFTVGEGSASGTAEAVFVDGNGCWLKLVPGSGENGLVDKTENGKYLKLNFVTDPCQELQKRDQGWEHHETDPNIPRIDRVAIIVKDIEKSTGFYTDVLGLKLHPMKFGVDPDANKDIGGFKPAFIFANSIWLVLIQPVGAGPLMDTLEEKGDGHILEVITEVDDLDVFYERMKSKGAWCVSMA